MDEPLTKSLERYDVLDRIAVGGMAEVFLAKAYGAHGFEKTLAIKRILPELARDPEFEARFIAEAKVAVRLSHANVVQVLDFGRIGESLFIAMEFVDGLDLAAMLRKFKDEKRLVPLPAAFHIAIEIVRALDFAHGHNIVHRDVSPSNVLVSRAGEVKIADFGIAVAAQPHRNSAPGPKRVMGKWRYMSPEQTRGDTLDTRSDLFSAASVIFELFTGEKLFPGDEAEDIIKNIHNMAIPKMSSLRPGLPSRLDEVLAGPLARKPIDRPTRPATVLRSLIELSYESSIMATALDVADALGTVIPAKRATGSGALDDVIRKQLNEQSVARRTAVTDGKPPSTQTFEAMERGAKGEVSTGLFRKIDVDGLPRLEEVDAATSVAAPRAKRNTSQGDHMPGDTDLHALYDASQDRDRHTEVGGPPTGQVPKLGDSMNTMKPATDLPAAGPRRLVWVLVALVIVVLGSVAVWAMTRSPAVTPPPPVDAQTAPREIDAPPAPPPVKMGKLQVISTPPGAIVTINGTVLGPAPTGANVSAGVKVPVKLELKGYETIEVEYTLNPGQDLTIKETLVPALATLQVETTPAGAQVVYNGATICATTPCKPKLAAVANGVFMVSKDRHESQRHTLTLVGGETTPLKVTLKEEQKYGYVRITVEGTPVWGDVFHNGQRLGMSKDAGGPIPLRIAVGRQTLRIAKGDKSGFVTVDIAEGKTTNVTFSWPK